MSNLIEQSITKIIEATVHDLGFEIVKISLSGVETKTLEILIDRLDNQKVSIEDCQLVSRNISALLDIEDIIPDKYYLHLSSAGAERPLTKIEDYNKFTGREVKVKLKERVNNCGHFKGKIVKTENNSVEIEVKEGNIWIPFNQIKNAHLVMTDKMFRELLNKK